MSGIERRGRNGRVESGAGVTDGRFAAVRDRLRELLKNANAEKAILAALEKLNGKKKDSSSFNELQALLSGQHYKLAYWQNVNENINYRRFFAITELVGMRVEEIEEIEGELPVLVPVAELRIEDRGRRLVFRSVFDYRLPPEVAHSNAAEKSAR